MNKEEYKIHAENLISDISNRIDELRQRGSGVNPAVQAEFDEKMQHLVEMRNDLMMMRDEFDNIPENRWEQAKQEFMNGIDYLKEGFQKLFSVLSK